MTENVRYALDLDKSKIVMPDVPAPTPALAAICILTTNERDNTLACIESLEAAGHPKTGYAVILADNGSTDGTMEEVARRHPWVVRILNGSNLGFAGGNNTSMRWALDRGFRYVMLLNNDTEVPEGAIETLAEFMDVRPAIGLLQPLLIRHGDRSVIDSAGIDIFSIPGALDRQMERPVTEAPEAPERVFGATGAGAFFRADALRKAGLLDEAFYLLLEDVDLSFRLRLEGYDAMLVPGSRIYHKRGISSAGEISDEKKFLLLKNMTALAIRYWPAKYLLQFAPFILKGWLWAGRYACLTGRGEHWRRFMRRSREERRANRKRPQWRQIQEEWMVRVGWSHYLHGRRHRLTARTAPRSGAMEVNP